METWHPLFVQACVCVYVYSKRLYKEREYIYHVFFRLRGDVVYILVPKSYCFVYCICSASLRSNTEVTHISEKRTKLHQYL